MSTACVNWCDSGRCDSAGTGKFETHRFSELSWPMIENVCIDGLSTNIYIYELNGFYHIYIWGFSRFINE